MHLLTPLLPSQIFELGKLLPTFQVEPAELSRMLRGALSETTSLAFFFLLVTLTVPSHHLSPPASIDGSPAAGVSSSQMASPRPLPWS